MSYSSEVLADSPLIFLRLGDSSGTTATDSSGNGRNGTYTGSPTLGSTGLLTGDANTAITITTSGQGATVADDNSLDGLSTFTVEAWINATSSLSGTNYIVNRDDGGSNRSFLFRVSSNKLQFVKVPNGTVTATGATTMAAATTYHVAAVYNGTDIRLYLNGVLDNTPAAASGTLGSITRILEIAQRLSASPLVGVFDEVAVYGTALSATRIAAHYTAGTTAGSTAASGSGSLSLSASGSAAGATTGSAALALSGSGSTTLPDGGAGALSLSATGDAAGPNTASGDAALSLSATASTSSPATGDLALTAGASGAAAADTGGTGSLSLSASGIAHRAATGYEGAVLDVGPIAYYRMGEPSGTTMVDDSGNGRDGAYILSPTLGATGLLLGDSDTAVTFTGSNDGSVSFWSGLNSASFTHTGLIRTSVSGRHLGGRQGQAAAPIFYDIDSLGRLAVTINSGTSAATYTSTAVVADFKKRVIAIRRDGGTGTLSILINGAVDSTFSSTLTPDATTSQGFILGHDVDFGSGSFGFSGTLDEWALFDSALSDSTLATLATVALGASSGALLSLSAAGAWSSLGVAGTGSLSLSGSGEVPTPIAATALLEFAASGSAVPLYVADTSNAFDGLDMVFAATATVVAPAVTPPSSLADKYDKALPYPQPVMVGGRPT